MHLLWHNLGRLELENPTKALTKAGGFWSCGGVDHSDDWALLRSLISGNILCGIKLKTCMMFFAKSPRFLADFWIPHVRISITQVSHFGSSPQKATHLEALFDQKNRNRTWLKIYLVKFHRDRKHDRKPQKVASWKWNPVISGTPRLVKYYNLARRMYAISGRCA